MNSIEIKLIDDLIYADLDQQSFLSAFRRSTTIMSLINELLEESILGSSSNDLMATMSIGFKFGFEKAHLPKLRFLSKARWHLCHEDIISVLDEFRDPDSIPYLLHATQWVPEYLDFDNARALAVKAIWAIGNTPGEAADEALQKIALDENPVVCKNALEQIARRKARQEKDVQQPEAS